MKALSRKAQEQKEHDRVDKYIRDNYEEVIYDAISMNAANIVRQTVADVLLGMSLHGYGAKRLNDAMDWVVEVLNFPDKMLGTTVNGQDTIDALESKYGLDFSKINPKYESYAEFKSRTADDASP